jgi:hypothetical protein
MLGAQLSAGSNLDPDVGLLKIFISPQQFEVEPILAELDIVR